MNILFLTTWAISVSRCWPCCSSPLCVTFFKHLKRGARLIDKLPQIRLVYILIFSLVAHSNEIKLLAMAYRTSITDPSSSLTQRSPPRTLATWCQQVLCGCWRAWKL